MVKKTRVLYPQSIWDEEAVLDAFDKYGINKAHHDRFMRALYDQFSSGKINRLDQFTVPDLNMSPKVLNITKSADFTMMTSKVIKREDSKDKSTTKLLIELQDGEHIETVLMRYSNTQSTEHTRTTICVSSQIGCAQACTFCATGTLGLTGSLTQGEIIEQYVWCDSQIESVRNLVFMGQGEPLSNDVYRNVMKSVQILTANTRFSLRQNRVTVSTVGVVDNMYRTIDECPGVTIALSLHAPTQTMRQQIVPSARKYSLKELVEVIDYYFEKTKKKMLIEYVMLDDVNSSEETAHLLGKLLQNRSVLINLIPFNPVLTKAKHIAPSHETVAKFAEIVASYGLLTTTRKEFGQDISGACGQLSSGVKKNIKEVKQGAKITDEFTADEVAVIYGHDDDNNNTDEKNTNDETSPNTKQNNNNDDDDDDVVDNGLEGLVSAFGWMSPENNDNGEKNDDGKYIDTTEVGVTRESILDNSTTCGGEPITSPNATMDMEDLMTNVVNKKQEKKELTEEEKIKQQATTPVCEDNCGCHRELKHKQVTEGIDPKDVMAWSLAVLSLGPILKHEQNIFARGKGETEKGRLRRLIAQQILPESALLGEDQAMDECVAGDEELDQFDENMPIGGSVGPRRNLMGDNLSQNTGLTNFSMTSSQLRKRGPVSTLKIQPREKDLLARVIIPKKEDIEAAQAQPQMDLDKAGWDATPETFKHTDDASPSKTTPTTTTTTTNQTPSAAVKTNATASNTPVNITKTDNDTEQQQKMYVVAAIAIIFAILAARRVM